MPKGGKWPDVLPFPSAQASWEHCGHPYLEASMPEEGKEFSTTSPGTLAWFSHFSWAHVRSRDSATAGVRSSPSQLCGAALLLFLIVCSWPPLSPRPGQRVGASCGDKVGTGAGWQIRVAKGQNRTQPLGWRSRLKHCHQQLPH